MELIRDINAQDIMIIISLLSNIIFVIKFPRDISGLINKSIKLFKKTKTVRAVIAIVLIFLVLIFIFLILPVYSIIASVFWITSWWRYLIIVLSLLGLWNFINGIKLIYKFIELFKELPELSEKDKKYSE